MDSLADQFSRMTVTATSPDGQISAEVSWEGRVLSLKFRPGAYHRYTEVTVAHQLAQTATLLWTRQRRYYREIIDATFENPIHDDAPDIDPRQRTYLDRLGKIIAEGASRDNSVRIRTEGMTRWEFTVAEGALRKLPEPEFVTQTSDAVAALLTHHRSQMLLLRDDVYGVVFPDLPWLTDANTPRER
jgi:hypothetical protein